MGNLGKKPTGDHGNAVAGMVPRSGVVTMTDNDQAWQGWSDTDTVRIDLHCHSTFSDGTLSPQAIARHCVERDVRFAALTDHNSIEGLDAFESACERYGVGFIGGLEVNVVHGFKELHLLCYGFDRSDAGLVRALVDLKASQASIGSAYAVTPRCTATEMIDTIHRAGGIVILSHPLVTEPDEEKLIALAESLFAVGMDGLETGSSQMDASQERLLRELAARHGKVVSSGTDHHALTGSAAQQMGIEVSVAEWIAFRDCLIRHRHETQRLQAERPPASPRSDRRGNAGEGVRMFVQMVLPALAVIILSSLTLFGYILPRVEEALLERKRETIMELTRTVWSMLDEANRQVRLGQMTPEEARVQASERIRALRYGREGKDYFWLQDLSPKMIMHPYRQDLEGQDLADFRDPRGITIFTVFADRVRQDGSGYVDYVWQWKDDPDRMEAKESYIRLFEPWGWVIGTGLYIDDVHEEIRILEMHIFHAMLAITGAVIVLLLFMVRGGLGSERERRSAERRLQESNRRYASLVQAAAEGVLFVRNRRCIYANPVFLELAGCAAEDLPLLDWFDLFPYAPLRMPEGVDGGEQVSTATLLRRRDGTTLDCRMALKGMPERDTDSFVVLIRRPEESGPSTRPADDSLLKRLLNLPSATAEDIAREVAQADSVETVVALCLRTPELVRAMLESGASPIAIASMISAITDSATGKLIVLTQAELGPEPVPFAFAAVGSQGRREQTLFTDQDNIIVYANPPPGMEATATDYFAALANRVCEYLAKAGYRDCKGLLMASNPKWCQPMDAWRALFSRWIRQGEGQKAMDLVTLYDLRCVYGDETLIRDLCVHIQEEIGRAPWFFIQAAQNAIQFKTPLRIFGNIVTTGRSVEKTGHLDIKAAMMPVVAYARLYALKYGLNATGTQERLSALCDRGFMLPSRYRDLMTALETLMRLRLRHQSEICRNGGEPDNLINPSWLGHIDEAVLRECFSEIDRIQNGIGKEFLGGESGNQ